jgi:HAE1 family hydrophobic/amphiphilic exporter-1
MLRYNLAVEEVLRKNPYLEDAFTRVDSSNVGFLNLRLKPREGRPHVEQVSRELRRNFETIPGLRVFLSVPPAIRLGGYYSSSVYQFTLQSPETQDLYRYAPQLETRLRQIPGLVDVKSDLQMEAPKVRLDIDRDKAAMLGISSQHVEDALYSSFGSRQVSTIYGATDAYRVILELMPEFQTDPSVLSLLYVRSNNGTMVPMSELASASPAVGPVSVQHNGQVPAVTLSFNLAPGYALGDAVVAVSRAAREVLPSSIATSFQGNAQLFQSSQGGLVLLLVMSVLVIYVVLGILYESLAHPFTILSGLPAAGFGALVTLYLFDMDLNLYAFVGIIMLVGIVKKNAIMMIDFALDAQRNSARSPADAIYQGAMVRFRPIMMTTMAALMGTLPIALGYGAGGESRRPLGLAVVGGLLFSQLLTLYITPVYYVRMEGVQRWLAAHLRFRRRHHALPALPQFDPEQPVAEHHD